MFSWLFFCGGRMEDGAMGGIELKRPRAGLESDGRRLAVQQAARSVQQRRSGAASSARSSVLLLRCCIARRWRRRPSAAHTPLPFVATRLLQKTTHALKERHTNDCCRPEEERPPPASACAPLSPCLDRAPSSCSARRPPSCQVCLLLSLCVCVSVLVSGAMVIRPVPSSLLAVAALQ